ncbi:MAG: DUF4136 domain-containing protein [Pseudomonadota bacterium]
MKVWFPLIALLVLVGCASTADQPWVAYDAQDDFSSYQTFAWVSAKPLVAPTDEIAHLDEVEAGLIATVESEFALKGLARVDHVDDADLVLVMMAGRLVNDDFDYPVFDTPGGSLRHITREPGDTSRSTLSIFVLDTDSQSLVWQAKQDHALNGDWLVRTEPTVTVATEAATQMLAFFPPQG